MKKALVLFGMIVIIFISCSKDSPSGGGGGGGGGGALNCTGVAKSFSSDVNPIIQGTCATSSDCHGSGSSNGPGALQTYNQIFNARAAIRGAVASGAMPKTGSITTTQKNAILCWIDDGAANN
jgi:hypothetical protein